MPGSTECSIDIAALRAHLGAALTEIAASTGPEGMDLLPDIGRSAQAIQNDRSILVTSLGAPITGQLLGAFGAFLDRLFREYDYYVGVYDAINVSSSRQCELRFSPTAERVAYLDCIDELSAQLYRNLNLPSDAKARYVFALLAEGEYGNEGAMQFAYAPMPEEDRDMRFIHDGLNQVLGRSSSDNVANSSDAVLVERGFFEYLNDQGFTPTPTPEGDEPLLALIIEDPDNWAYELTKRWTTRIVYLEREAEKIYAQREPDPEKRQTAQTEMLGVAAWGLQTATYKYPPFAFAPSTAPERWIWRNLIPYEVAVDIVESDLSVFWQPTWNVGGKTNLGIRFGLGFAGGFLQSSNSVSKGNYGTAGFDVSFLTKTAGVSSYGFTPAVFHVWDDPGVVDQTTIGFDVHAGFLKNRVRVGLGARDATAFRETWFLTLSIADLPGMIYWMTR